MKIQDPFKFNGQKSFSGFFIAAGILAILGFLMSMKPAPPPQPVLAPPQIAEPKVEAVVQKPIEAVEVIVQQCETQERLEEVQVIIGLPKKDSTN